MRYLVVLLMFLAAPVRAETFFTIPTTPDFSLSASSTLEVVFARVADWIYIRNHCADDVYFAINPKRAGTDSNIFSLRLKQNEVFVVPLRVHSVGASSVSTSTCLFTIMVGGR